LARSPVGTTSTWPCRTSAGELIPVATANVATTPYPFGPLCLGAGEPRVRPQRVEIELPRVDVEAVPRELGRLTLLQVGLGRGSGDAGNPDQLHEAFDEGGFVESAEDACFVGGELSHDVESGPGGSIGMS